MLKQLTLAFCAALLPACIISDGTTASDSNSNSNSATDTSSTSGDGTTGTGDTTEAPTTVNPTGTGGTTTDPSTTDVPTTGVTTTDTSTGGTSEMTSSTTETTGGALYGQCGWATVGYYACAPEGDPGVADPEMQDPIACPPDLEVGGKCDENGPVSGVGCCTPEGVLYYCDVMGQTGIYMEDCGA